VTRETAVFAQDPVTIQQEAEANDTVVRPELQFWGNCNICGTQGHKGSQCTTAVAVLSTAFPLLPTSSSRRVVPQAARAQGTDADQAWAYSSEIGRPKSQAVSLKPRASQQAPQQQSQYAARQAPQLQAQYAAQRAPQQPLQIAARQAPQQQAQAAERAPGFGRQFGGDSQSVYQSLQQTLPQPVRLVGCGRATCRFCNPGSMGSNQAVQRRQPVVLRPARVGCGCGKQTCAICGQGGGFRSVKSTNPFAALSRD